MTTKRKIAYRFKTKIPGGDWRPVVDNKGKPIYIFTDKPQNTVLHIFKKYYPAIADSYISGETLIEEPDLEETKRREEFLEKQKEEEEERRRGMWWNKDLYDD